MISPPPVRAISMVGLNADVLIPKAPCRLRFDMFIYLFIMFFITIIVLRRGD